MLIKGKNEHGGDIYSNKITNDFSANTSPMGTPEFIKKAIVNSVEEVSAYPDSYCSELRIAISQYENLEKDFIICGNGASDIIFSFINGIKPKNALVVSPTFCEYENVLLLVGSQISYHDLNAANQFQLTEEILSEINNQLDVLFICNPNNPTGQLYSKRLMMKIANACKDCHVLLFIDECFMDLTDNPKEFSMVEEIKANQYIFILKAFTKSFGMAGVRLGYGLSSNEFLLEHISNHSQLWNVSTIAQKAGVAAMKNVDYLEEVRGIIREQRNYLTKELTSLGFEIIESKVNFILFQAETDLYEKLLQKQILIRKCDNFRGLDAYTYRCAVKSSEENRWLIKALQEIENRC